MRYGYPVETYKVVTSDGYILTTNRIPHNGRDYGSKRTPIFIQHGASVDAASWFLIGNKSLRRLNNVLIVSGRNFIASNIFRSFTFFLIQSKFK